MRTIRVGVFIAFAWLLVLNGSTAQGASEQAFKKIQVVKTNNSPDVLLIGSWVAPKPEGPYLARLRKYVELKGFKPRDNSELDFVIGALAWVTSQWKHDGMNQPPSSFRALQILQSVHSAKARYRCVEYGVVLAELLQSYGFVARKVALRSPNVAYGGFGQGHVAMEVWLNDLNKWIFLDPQFGAFLTKPNSPEPLNFYELFLQKKTGSWASLEVHFSPSPNLNAPNSAKNLDATQIPETASSDYKKFLSEYFGFMTVSSSMNDEFVSLLMESSDQPLTFQGGPNNNALFTSRAHLLYPPMNRVALLLSYRDGVSNFQEMTKALKIETNEDFLANMGAFAAKPRYRVKVKSAEDSSKKSFEYRTSRSGKWEALKGNEFNWDAMQTQNYVEVRRVNSLGRRGPSTFVELRYE